MSFQSREDYIYFARLSEQGERYEDMIRYMKEVSRVSLESESKLNPIVIYANTISSNAYIMSF
jgi:hypothetical protein